MKKDDIGDLFDITDTKIQEEAGNLQLDDCITRILNMTPDIGGVCRKIGEGKIAETELEERSCRVKLPRAMWEAFEVMAAATRATELTTPAEDADDLYAQVKKATDLSTEDVIVSNAVLNHIVSCAMRIHRNHEYAQALKNVMSTLEKDLKTDPPKDD